MQHVCKVSTWFVHRVFPLKLSLLILTIYMNGTIAMFINYLTSVQWYKRYVVFWIYFFIWSNFQILWYKFLKILLLSFCPIYIKWFQHQNKLLLSINIFPENTIYYKKKKMVTFLFFNMHINNIHSYGNQTLFSI